LMSVSRIKPASRARSDAKSAKVPARGNTPDAFDLRSGSAWCI
jgi:hypothetical protein